VHALRIGETICYSPDRAFCEVGGVAFAAACVRPSRARNPNGVARQFAVNLHAADALHEGAMQGVYHIG